MLNYEACVILNAQLPEVEVDSLIDKLKNQLVSGGAQITEISRWGKRRLAYEINKAQDGFYVVYYFQLQKAGDVLTNFQRVCKYDDNVLREMVFNVPLKKKKQEIRQLVPTPGWMSEFTMKLRPHMPRRRSDYSRGPRYGDRGPDSHVEPEAPVATVEPVAEGTAAAGPVTEEPGQTE